MCLLSGIAVKVNTCQEIHNRARERQSRRAPGTADKKKMFAAFACRGRHENVNVEKPRLIYDQNE